MKLVRAVVISLLISLLAGLVIGTWIRLRLEAPVRYIGQNSGQSSERADSGEPIQAYRVEQAIGRSAQFSPASEQFNILVAIRRTRS